MSRPDPGPVVRTAPATLGQLSQWYEQSDGGAGQAQRNLPRTWTLERPVPRTAALDALRELVGRHEGLRTTFRLADSGELVQRVHEVRVPPVMEMVVPAGASAEQRDEQWRKPLVGRAVGAGFDLAHEWPVRFCLTLDEQSNVLAVDFVVNHVAIDAWAGRILSADLRQLLGGGTGTALPAGRPRRYLQPCDIAELESSPRGRARRTQAIEFLREQLRAVPSSVFPAVDAAATGDADARLLMTRERDMACVVLRSPAIYHASRWLAQQRRLSVPALVLAPYLGLLAHYAGQPVVPVKAMVNNRFDTRTRDTVACLTQPVLVCYESPSQLSGLDLARRCYWALLKSYRHAQYDIQAAARLVVEEGVRRGEPLNIERRFDFRDIERDVPIATPPTDRQLDVSASERESSGKHRASGPELALLVQIERGLATVALWGDIACVPEADIDRILLGMEAALVDGCRGGERTIAALAASIGL